jgi:DNA polymerase-3 subunit epsilon
MREIILDTETTGFLYSEGDRIIEIGCVEVIDKKITGNTYHTYINPGRKVSAAATEVSGLTYDFLKKFKPFKEIYQEFLDFVCNDRLVIHNAPFDMGFLNFELSLVDVPVISCHVIDTLEMAKKKYPGSPATLDALCRKFSVNSTMRTKHGALIDAGLLAEVYLHMSVEMLQKDIFGTAQVVEDKDFTRDSSINILEIRDFALSKTELDAHEKLLQKISDPIWNKLFN